jgi:hypothetical protein
VEITHALQSRGVEADVQQVQEFIDGESVGAGQALFWARRCCCLQHLA